MNISEIRIRDPYILKHKDTYYLFGSTDKNTWGGKASGFDYYISKDLSEFRGPFTAFRRNPDFWANENFWAPEVYEIDGQFYMAAFCALRRSQMRFRTAALRSITAACF